jgi:hypothetical protein
MPDPVAFRAYITWGSVAAFQPANSALGIVCLVLGHHTERSGDLAKTYTFDEARNMSCYSTIFVGILK